MLLIEIMRRAAHDWVLYRTSTRLPQRQIAEEAYNWLFVEGPGTPEWAERAKNKRELTSFLGICDVLSLDPDTVRSYIRGLTVQEILSAGRPPTYRRQKERRRKARLIPKPLPPPPPSPPPLPSVLIIHHPQIVAPLPSRLAHLLNTVSKTAHLLMTACGL
jgi:hypothetical protein